MATMLSGLGGAAGYGENRFSTAPKALGNNDDGAVRIDLSPVFDEGIDYFGATYTDIYVNSNGLISFGSAHSAYNQGGGLPAVDKPAIVAFWSDVDISKGGEIYWDLDPAAGRVTVTWASVAPYSGSGRNSFQIVLTDTGGGNFQSEIIYGDIQWTSGGGGVQAVAGLTDGGSYNEAFEGSGDATRLATYESQDFGGADPSGTVVTEVQFGYPEGYGVDGTDGADAMGLGFADIDGQQITAGADLVDAGAGNDTVDAGGGNDTLYGGSGADLLTGGAGSDSIAGGSGDDTIRFADGWGADTVFGDEWDGTASGSNEDTLDFSAVTSPVTVTFTGWEDGTASSGTNSVAFANIEAIIGTSSSDTIDASADGSSVSLDGGGGSDSITGGSGSDTILGGSGNDTILYGDGDDSVLGGSGADYIDDSAGSTTGRNWIDGGSGNDTIRGAGGADTIYGGTGRDDIDSDGGDDRVDGGGDDDTIRSHQGNDTISGGTGADRIEAGDDADTILLSNGFGADTIYGGEGGTDDDLLDFSGVSGPVTLTYTGDEFGTATDGTDTLSFFQIERLILTGQDDTVIGGPDAAGQDIDAGAGDDSVNAGDGDNRILGGTGNDRVYSGAGRDTLDGGEGDDYLYGGAGDDSLTGGLGNDTLFAGDGLDTLDGGDGDDYLGANTGDATLLGGAGSDTLSATGGNDLLDGGDDADKFVVGDGFGSDTIAGGEGVTTGTDFDWISFAPLTSGITVTFSGDGQGSAGAGSDSLDFSGIERISGSAQGDTLDAGADGTGMSLSGEGGDDSIRGGSGNDTLEGGDGADTISGGDGSDLIDGGDGDDLLTTGAGDDTLIGGAGNDTLMNSTGDDSLVGGTGDDSIVASAGNDTLEGGDGDDTLIGGIDDDSLTGGDGNDVFVYAPGDGADIITDFNFGNTGTLSDGDATNNDFIDLSAFYDNLAELHADQADDGILNQSNATDSKGRTVDYGDNAAFGPGGSITFQGASADATSFTQENTGVVCFAAGTLIATPAGPVPIETLRPGDLVVTRDNGPQPVIWHGSRAVSHGELLRNPRLRPVRIAAEVLGAGQPLIVSRQHGILLDCPRAGEILVRAIHLVRVRGLPARILHGCREVRYHHLLFARHEIIYANGAATESFYPGRFAFCALDAAARDSIASLLPASALSRPETHFGAPARRFMAPSSRPGAPQPRARAAG